MGVAGFSEVISQRNKSYFLHVKLVLVFYFDQVGLSGDLNCQENFLEKLINDVKNVLNSTRSIFNLSRESGDS